MTKKQSVTIHGKEYYTVASRVKAFREIYGIDRGWGIVTDVLHSDEKSFTVYAKITNPDGITVATGLAREEIAASRINKVSALENAETSAIGRALAAGGFGGDGEYATADELQSKLSTQRQNENQNWNISEPEKKPNMVEALDQKMGFKSTGTLTWRQAAQNLTRLKDSRQSRQFLHQLKDWDKATKEQQELAKYALENIPNMLKGDTDE